MAFGRKNSEAPEPGIRATALVVAADVPVDNASRLSNVGRSTVRILIEGDGEPIYTARDFLLSEKRWLVTGMEIPVAIDPSRPDAFEVDWDAIPSIEDRVTANDPTLADPRGAKRKVIEALKRVGIARLDVSELPGGIGEAVAAGEEARKEATTDRFEEAIEWAASEPAPAGRTRAVVLVSTTTASLVSSGPDGGGPSSRSSDGKRPAVLAVNVPGREPYAVFDRKFKRPRNKGDAAGAGLPALVSATDPNDVEVLWDELPSLKSQVEQRISDGLKGAMAGIGAEEEAMERNIAEATERAIANPPNLPPAPNIPAAPAAGMGGAGAGALPDGMKETMAQGAKQALGMLKDPAQRKMLIDQYRSMGIDLEEDGGS